MRKCKKWLAAILSAVMILSVLLGPAPWEAYVWAASQETVIDNGYLKYALNRSSGGFLISTLEGHPQKKLDDNIPLLYAEANEGMETSFITVRIQDNSQAGYTDYIWGQDYSWLLGDGEGKLQVSEPVKEGKTISLQAVWSIQGLDIIQDVVLSTEKDREENTKGNVGISFKVRNNGNSSRKVSIRMLLDTALSNAIDAPYIMMGPEYTKFERIYSGEEMPKEFRGVDSLENPSRMCYAILNGWEGKEVDRVAVGHWANLANTRYDFTAEPGLNFNTSANINSTADNAMAFYWENIQVAAAETSEACQMLYGVGNFTSALSEKNVNINMTVGRVSLNQEKDGYADEGVFEVSASIDNTVDSAKPIKNGALALGLGEELELVTEAEDGYETTTTPVLPAEIEKEIITFKWRVKAKEQAEITAEEITVSLNSVDPDNKINEMAVRYVILPNARGKAAKVKFSGITPPKIYYEGSRSLTVVGEFEPFQALSASGWDLQLVPVGSQVNGDDVVHVQKKNISFDKENNNNFSFLVDETMNLGVYDLQFVFTDSELSQSFGQVLYTGMCVEVSNDPALRDPNYGLVALIRYNNLEYIFVPFENELAYWKFQNGQIGAVAVDAAGSKVTLPARNYLEGPSLDGEILVAARGKVTVGETTLSNGAKIQNYTLSKAADSNVTLNNCISCENNVVLSYDVTGNGYSANISGDGDIRVINSISFWKSKWGLSVTKGDLVNVMDGLSLSDHWQDDVQQLEIQLQGVGTMLQAVGGMLIDMKYGVLTSQIVGGDDDVYLAGGVSFGGSLSIPMSVVKSDKNQEEGTQKPADKEPTQDPPKEVSPTPKPPSQEEEEDDDGDLLKVEIDQILYGEKELKTEINPGLRGAGVQSDAGYIGTSASAYVGLPKDVMGKLISNAGGAYANVQINTIEGIYSLSAGLKLAMLECEGVISFKTVEINGGDKTVPDELSFRIADGMLVPLIPPTVFMTGIGGGISDLADTIGGDTISELPPITVGVYMKLRMMQVFTGEFEASVNATGLDLTGTIELDKVDALTIEGGLSAKWIDPFYFRVYGQVDVLGLIKGGVSVIIAEDYFHGYAFAAVIIPDSIPLAGGKKIASVEFGVSNKFIGGNIKIIGIRFGIIYYYDADSVEFGSGFDVGSMEGMEGSSSYGLERQGEELYAQTEAGGMEALAVEEMRATSQEGQEVTYKVVFGPNVKTLKNTKVEPVKVRQGLLKAAPGNTNKTVLDFDPSREDALLMEMSLPGDSLITTEQIHLTNPNGKEIPLKMASEKDEYQDGNLLIQNRPDGRYLYISITDSKQLVQGRWELSVDNPEVDIRNADVYTYGVDSLPQLESTEITGAKEQLEGQEAAVDAAKDQVKLSWTVGSGSDNVEFVGKINCYLNQDKDILTKLQKSQTNAYSSEKEEIELGTMIYSNDSAEIVNGKTQPVSVSLPEALPGGDYYLVTTMDLEAGATGAKVSETPIKIMNSSLPKPVESVSLTPAGNLQLLAAVQEAADGDYTEYYAELVDEKGETAASGFYAKGESMLFGKVLREETVDQSGNIVQSRREIKAGEHYKIRVRTVRTSQEEMDGVPVEKKLLSETVTETDYVEVPQFQPPRLISVTKEGIGNSRASEVLYTSQSHIKVSYTFDRELTNFRAYLDGMSCPALSVDNKIWTVETDVADGAHTIDFKAYAGKYGDVLEAQEAGALIGFVSDTEPPMLVVDSQSRENVEAGSQPSVYQAGLFEEGQEQMAGDADGSFTAEVSSQTVYTDGQYGYTVQGHTEPGVNLSFTEGSARIRISDDGNFTITGILDMGTDVSRTHVLSAADKAGNTSTINIYIMNGNLEYPARIEILNNGAAIDIDDNGEKVITMKVGERLNLSAVGYKEDPSSSETDSQAAFDSGRLQWDALYEGNKLQIDGGTITALSTGEAGVKVRLPYVTIDNGEKKQTAGPEDFVRLIIEEGSKHTLSYFSGGGIGKTPASQRLASGQVIVLPENPFTKEGLEFEGWTDGQKLYSPGTPYVMPNVDVRLTAKWKGEAIITPSPAPWYPDATPTPIPTPEPSPTPGIPPEDQVKIHEDGSITVPGPDRDSTEDDVTVLPSSDGTKPEYDPAAKKVTLPEGGYILRPDGKGGFIKNKVPAGTRVELDGTVTLPQGIVIKPDGGMILQDGTLLSPGADGSWPSLGEDGTITDSHGVRIEKDGTIILPGTDREDPSDDIIIRPSADGTRPVYNPESGTVTLTTGMHVTAPDGKGGAKEFVAGENVEIAMDGILHYPDGSRTDLDGNIVGLATSEFEGEVSGKIPNKVNVTALKGGLNYRYEYVLCKSPEDFENGNYFRRITGGDQTEAFQIIRMGTYYLYGRSYVRDQEGRRTYSDWSGPSIIQVGCDTPNAAALVKTSVKGRTVSVTYKTGARTKAIDVFLGRQRRMIDGQFRPVNYGSYKLMGQKAGTRTVTFKNVKPGTYYIGLHPYILYPDSLKSFGRWNQQNNGAKVVVK